MVEREHVIFTNDDNSILFEPQFIPSNRNNTNENNTNENNTNENNTNTTIPDDIRICWLSYGTNEYNQRLIRVYADVEYRSRPWILVNDDIEIIITQTTCTREQAIRAYINENMDLVDAIIRLTFD